MSTVKKESDPNLDTEDSLGSGEIAASIIRNHPLFRQATGSQADKIAALEKQIADMAAAKEEEARQKEIAAKEARGEYDSVLADMRNRMEQQEKLHKKDLLERDLQSEFLRRGVTNAKFIKGSIADFTGGSIAEYVDALAADPENALIFAKKASPEDARQPDPHAVFPSNEGITSAREAMKGLHTSTDPKELRKYSKIVEEYVAQHGTTPKME